MGQMCVGDALFPFRKKVLQDLMDSVQVISDRSTIVTYELKLPHLCKHTSIYHITCLWPIYYVLLAYLFCVYDLIFECLTCLFCLYDLFLTNFSLWLTCLWLIFSLWLTCSWFIWFLCSLSRLSSIWPQQKPWCMLQWEWPPLLLGMFGPRLKQTIR